LTDSERYIGITLGCVLALHDWCLLFWRRGYCALLRPVHPASPNCPESSSRFPFYGTLGHCFPSNIDLCINDDGTSGSYPTTSDYSTEVAMTISIPNAGRPRAAAVGSAMSFTHTPCASTAFYPSRAFLVDWPSKKRVDTLLPGPRRTMTKDRINNTLYAA
jgi:hypothetical protein